MTHTKKVILFCGLFALAVTLAGCKSLQRQAAESYLETSTGADVDLKKDGMEITDKEGNTVSVKSGQGLPDGWPAEAVYLKDGDIIESSSLDLPQGKNFVISISTEKTEEEIFDFYKGELDSNGWAVKLESHSTDGSLLLAEKDMMTLSLLVDTKDGKRNVVQTVAVLK